MSVVILAACIIVHSDRLRNAYSTVANLISSCRGDLWRRSGLYPLSGEHLASHSNAPAVEALAGGCVAARRQLAESCQ